MKEKIINIIIESLKELNEDLNKEELKNPTRKTRLYGLNGTIDSLSLVALITDIEEKISESFGKSIVLVDERAMSQRLSPFRSVSALANYIEKLINE